jgi:hypothetical protein
MDTARPDDIPNDIPEEGPDEPTDVVDPDGKLSAVVLLRRGPPHYRLLHRSCTVRRHGLLHREARVQQRASAREKASARRRNGGGCAVTASSANLRGLPTRLGCVGRAAVEGALAEIRALLARSTAYPRLTTPTPDPTIPDLGRVGAIQQ